MERSANRNPVWEREAQLSAAAYYVGKDARGPSLARLRLHEAQSEILATSKRFNVVSCGRRFGKTQLAIDLLIETSLTGDPAAYFAPTYKMLSETWNDLVEIARPGTQKISVQERRLELTTGGVIDCWSFEAPDACRGRKYKRAVVDEAAHSPGLKKAWQSAIRPTLTDLRGDAWFPSTPYGMNDFWQLYQLGVDPLETEWMSWQMPTSRNPYIDAAEIEAARHMLPQSIFEQEYLARFNEDGGAVFRNLQQCAIAREQNYPEPHHVYVVGCDFGKHEDFSVNAVIDCTTRELVKLERFNQIEYVFQIDRLKALCELFQPRQVIAEETGNLALVELLWRIQYKEAMTGRYVSIPLQAFKTTNASKAEIIQSLALAFERRELKILNDQVLLGELQAFTMERLPSGMIRYTAPEGLHDDTVMGLALAWSAAHLIPKDLNLNREDRVILKYGNQLTRQIERAHEAGVSDERIASIVQTNLINRERELESAGRTGHYLTQND